MKIIAKAGNDNVATVYIAENSRGQKFEFVESIQPPLSREEKWVLIVSSLYGCPVRCRFCDAGGSYSGKMTHEDLLFQTDYLVNKRYPDGNVQVDKFKIQFARMGEPAFNMAVLDVIEQIPDRYNLKSFMPSVSTVAPEGCDPFFDRLLSLSKSFLLGSFQMQFSIHSTDEAHRDWLIPVKKWGFNQISKYGEEFYRQGDRKITLNFALAKDTPIDANVLLDYFDPQKFLVKVTPLNPTYKAVENSLHSLITVDDHKAEVLNGLRRSGYDVILSIGEWEENLIGSNCGQYITNYSKSGDPLDQGYTYQLERLF